MRARRAGEPIQYMDGALPKMARTTKTTTAAAASAAAVPLLLTAAQTAELLGRSTETLKSWRRAGLGPDYVTSPGGRLIGYRPTDIDAWLSAQTVVRVVEVAR